MDDLPPEILEKIITPLSTLQAVRTCFVFKDEGRRSTWKNLQSLDFTHVPSISRVNFISFVHFVIRNRSLNPILNFTLNLSSLMHDEMVFVKDWVNYAAQNKVSHVNIDMVMPNDGAHNQIFQNLLQLDSLQTLILRCNCALNAQVIKLPQLTKICLSGIIFDKILPLISMFSTPNLAHLELIGCRYELDSFSIVFVAKKLTFLKIDDSPETFLDFGFQLNLSDYRIKISAPALNVFIYTGDFIKKYRIESNLTRASISFKDISGCMWSRRHCRKLLQSIRSIEHLELTEEALPNFESADTVFHNLRSLAFPRGFGHTPVSLFQDMNFGFDFATLEYLQVGSFNESEEEYEAISYFLDRASNLAVLEIKCNVKERSSPIHARLSTKKSPTCEISVIE